MCCHLLVGVFDKSVCNEHSYDDLEPLSVIPPDGIPVLSQDPPTHDDMPSSLPMLVLRTSQQTNQPTEHAGTATQPTHNEAEAKGPNLEPNKETDIFDNEEEYVRVDQYHLHNPPQNGTSHQDDENFVPILAEGCVPLEVEVNGVDPQEINVLRDLENSNVYQGALYSDAITFMKL